MKDYTLTTIGLEPALPALIERFKAHDVYRDNWEGTMNMSSSKWVLGLLFLEPISSTDPGVLQRPEWITVFLSKLREKYGTAESYVKSKVGLSDGDIEKIRGNLLVPRPVQNHRGD